MANIYFTLIDQFRVRWEKKYRGEKFYPRKHHFKQLRELMTPAEGFEAVPGDEVLKRMDVFLSIDYWRVCKHNISKFIEYFDNFAPPERPKDARPLKLIFCEKCGYNYYEGHRCMCGLTERQIQLAGEPVPLGDLIDGFKATLKHKL